MKKFILGLTIGILSILLVRTAYAEFKGWNIYFDDDNSVHAARFQDGNVNCYVARIYSTTWTPPSISCVKVK